MNKLLNAQTRKKFQRLVPKKNPDEKYCLRVILAYDLGLDVSDIAEIMQLVGQPPITRLMII